MPVTNFPKGFARGVSIRGIPLPQAQPGQVFFVGNSSVLNPQQRPGSDGNRGTYLDPFATLNYAVNSVCVHARGDTVFVLPGHKETISSAAILTLRKAGVAVVGLGSGSSRPVFTFTTATTANIPVSATDVSIQNCVFVGNFLSIASCFTAISASCVTSTIAGTTATLGTATGTVYPGASLMGTGVAQGTVILEQLTGTAGAAGTYRVNISQTVASATFTTGAKEFAIDNCEFRDMSTILGFLSVFTSSATANASDGFSFTNNVVASLSTVSPTVALTIAASQDRVSLLDNKGTSAITAVTQGPALLAAGANNITNFDCGRNRFMRPNTSATLPVGIATSGTAWSGLCYDNHFWALPSGTGIWISTGSKLGFTNNFSPITGAADKSALINPVAV